MTLKDDNKAELSVGKVIGVVILVIIGLLMLPIVNDSVTSAAENLTNAGDTTAATLVEMVTIFYVLGVVLAAVIWVVAETRGFGRK